MIDMDKFAVVKKYIDEADCEGLLALGAPDDEYDKESLKISQLIDEKSTVDEVSRIISMSLGETMGEQYDSGTFDEISRKIVKELQTMASA